MIKRSVYLFFLGVIFLVSACGISKEKSEQRIVSMEERLFNSETGFSQAGADSLIQLYRDFAATYPNDSLSPVYLFKAASITMNLQDGSGAMALFDQIRESYPDFERVPLCLFFKGYIQENLMGDIDQARETYQLFIDTYPDHDFVDDAQASIDNLGKTPEQMIREFESGQKASTESDGK
ncbi:MAG: tetratricopeptide repeat protein [Bacteroidales bacterium]|nr:tetratricopeptide repeat protein [Bacteroidales bacterium]